MLGRVSLNGTAANVGKYKLVATVTDGVRTAKTNEIPFEIYDMNITFADRLANLPTSTKYWMMAPYFIKNTEGGATIPTHLLKIYGSNESGLYGIIGNEHAGPDYGQDVVVIPAGADLTFVNMKIFSSVKLVVEKGGKLTLDDSGSYGPIEVNGGTLTIKNSSSVVNSITLNEGSTLEDSHIISRSATLTDGNRFAENKGPVVTVNGNVDFKGTNTIIAQYGDASKVGQTGLQINDGTLNLNGGTLTVEGGGDKLVLYAERGGDAIHLNNGHIVGKNSTLSANGGIGHSRTGAGGHGITGNGTLDVSVINAKGGDGSGEYSILGTGKGGDSIKTSVKILNQAQTKLTAIGGKGNPSGLSYKVTEGTNSGAADNSGSTGSGSSNDSNSSPSQNQGNSSAGNNGSQNSSNQGSNAGTNQGGNSVSGSSGQTAGNNASSNSGTNSSLSSNSSTSTGTAQNNPVHIEVVDEAVALSTTQKFVDVPLTHWANKVIETLASKNIMVGTTATTFSPTKTLTKAEFITVIGRIVDAPDTTTSSSLHDVEKGSYYEKFAKWAVSKELIKAEDGKFYPNNEVTRGEITVIIAKLISEKAQKEVKVTNYKDIALADEITTKAIEKVTAEGIMNGYANGNFGVNDKLTRAELATIVGRLLTFFGK